MLKRNKNLLLLPLICLLGLFNNVMAQGIVDYLSAPFPSSLVASPDGKSVAWVFNDKGERNIYLAKAPDYEVLKLTDFVGDIGIGLGQLSFSPKGDYLIFVKGNNTNKAGEPANPAQLQMDTSQNIYALHLKDKSYYSITAGESPEIHPNGKKMTFLEKGTIHQIFYQDPESDSRPLFKARGSITQHSWSPNGKYLAFTSFRGDHAFLGIYNPESNSIRYIDPGIDQDLYHSWSPDGRKLAFLRIPNIHEQLPFTSLKKANPWSIKVIDMDNMKAEEIFRADEGIGSVVVRDLPATNERLWWTKDDKLIFPWEKNGWVQLYAIDLNSKEVSHLTPGDGIVENVQKSYTGEELLYTSNIGNIDNRDIWSLDLTSLKTKKVTEGDGIQWAPQRTADGLIYLSSNHQRPAWPVFQKEDSKTLLASNLFPVNFPDKMVKPITDTITAEDGFQSYGQIFLPHNYDPQETYPAVIFLHGGSRRQMLPGFHYSQYYSNAYALQQYFAAHGFIALTLNYRSGIGYGIEFREAENYGAGGASEVMDVLAAREYLAQRDDVDENQIFPWGGSYGGYLTAHVLGQAPGKFKAGVDIHGVHDWNNSIPVFSSWYRPEKYPEMAETAFKSSPMYYVKNWESPVLLIHGDDDRNVLFSESVELAEILRKQDVKVEHLVFPDEVHSFLLYKNWIAAYEATFNFIQKFVEK